MECSHAYFKNGIVYVFCDCNGNPKTNNLDELTKNMCGYQRFCPNVRTCTLLPEWRQCSKLKTAVEQHVDIIPAVTQKTSRKKKS